MKKFDLTRYTAIARPMDFGYTSNMVITLASVILFAGGFIFRMSTGSPWKESLFWGFGVSLSVFLSWALSRETEPGRDFPGYLSSAITLVLVFYCYPPGFIVLIWFMLGLRFVNRSTGQTGKWQDGIFVTLVSIWVVYIGFWEITVIGTFVFIADAFLHQRNSKQVVFAIIHALGFFGLISTQYLNPDFRLPTIEIIILMIVLLAGVIATTVMQNEVTTRGDNDNKTLHLSRIKATRIIALFSTLVVVFWNGDDGFQRIMPLFAAILASMIYRLLIIAGFWKPGRKPFHND